MPRQITTDAHEWINEIPTVPIYYLAKPQPREEVKVIFRERSVLELEITGSREQKIK